MKRSFIIWLTVLLSTTLFAQDVDIPEDISKVATRACQFLKLEVGAEAAALGGARVAGVNDLSALHWNPPVFHIPVRAVFMEPILPCMPVFSTVLLHTAQRSGIPII
ncbi:MAG: hypothetical protein U5N56_04560 [Candidatus Marinimicrobia bacterium]|nr:hypothetical protein [Candidatus Neomarinimicrobiota bacterium]